MIVRVEAVICNSRNFMGLMTIGRSMPINTGSAIAEVLTIRNPIICNSRNFIGSYDNATYALSVSATAEILWGLMTF